MYADSLPHSDKQQTLQGVAAFIIISAHLREISAQKRSTVHICFLRNFNRVAHTPPEANSLCWGVWLQITRSNS